MWKRFAAWLRARAIAKLEERVAVCRAEVAAYARTEYANPYFEGELAKAQCRLNRLKGT